MSKHSEYRTVIRSAWTFGEITSPECLAQLFEYIDRRKAGWPSSTVTGMYVGGFRNSFPISAALVDGQIAAARELSRDECNAIVAQARSDQLEEFSAAIAASVEKHEQEKRTMVEAASWVLQLAR